MIELRHKLSGFILLATLTLSANYPARAADVTITVNGTVVARPCTVSTPSATIDLGDLYTYDMATAGSASPWKSVTLNLSNCPVGTSRVTAVFSGTADGTGYYRNLGTAGNIQLQLADTGGVTLNNGATKTVQVNDSSLSAAFPLQVRALTVNGNASQGSIQSVISITYIYL